MASFWKDLLSTFSRWAGEADERVNDEYRNDSPSCYPKTYPRPTKETKDEAPLIFEPALLQFQRAFRLGDPAFADPEAGRKWHESRDRVIDHILGIITASKWKDHLVLRGSLLLKAWMGDAAREPGDIDWVFSPETVGIEDSLATRLFEELTSLVSLNPTAGNALIEVHKIAVDDIWTYERAAGKRIIFPWKSEGIPPGSVQMDVVFKERLWCDPVETLIPTYGNNGKTVLSVNKEVSLAWKLLWLETDMYPQGKDLYDATLLAEQTHLPLSLLKQVLRSGDWNPKEELTVDFPLKWQIDWENFKLEYPWIEGEAKEWQARLSSALASTFEANNSSNG